jgi:phospholipid/cholesterol/gamma-HCH transport system permease protein
LWNRFLAGLALVGSLYSLAVDTIWLLFRSIIKGRFPWREFVNQAWFLVSVSLLPTVLIAIPFGVIIALEVGGIASQIGATSFVGAIDAIGTVREASPIVVALLLAGAGGSAICSDLGARTIRDEIAALEVLGISPLERLVAPRVAATVLVAVLLNGIVSFVGIMAGYVFAVTVLHGTAGGYLGSFSEFAKASDLVASTIKAAAFGAFAALIASWKGLNAKKGATGVGNAVQQSVVITGVFLFLINLILSEIYFAIVPQRIG